MKNRFYLHKAILIAIILCFFCSIDVYAQQKASYQVKQGDTLYNISKRLEVTIAELKEWNDLTSNEIELGQELIYYLPEPQHEQTEELPEEPSNPLVNRSSDSPNTYYMVKSGDTLYRIARQHNMTVEQLKQLNSLTDNNLRVGQKLSVRKIEVAPSVGRYLEESTPQGVFSVYKIKTGENIEELLNKFKMTEEEFFHLNPGLEIRNLSSGQEVTVLLPPSRKYKNPYLKKANLQDLGEVKVTQYGESDIGKTTTNGELYDPKLLTAAHSNIALGSIIFVENKKDENGIYVRVNDRITESGLKLSNHAFETLGFKDDSEPVVIIYTETE